MDGWTRPDAGVSLVFLVRASDDGFEALLVEITHWPIANSSKGPGGHVHDVVVIGLGAVGSQTVRALAQQGASVLGLEQFCSPHTHGSHHGHTRVTRHAYFEHPDYVPLLRHATAAWETLERASNTRLLERCGILLHGPANSTIVRSSAEAAARWGVEVEELDAHALRARFGAFATADEDIGLFEPGGGFLRPEGCIAAALAAARTAGATLHSDAEVLGLEERADHLRVQLADRTLRARTAVVTVGAWTARLAPELGRLLEVTRQVQGWVQPDDVAAAAGLPCWLVDRGEAPPVYGVPVDPHGLPLAKVAVHGDGTPVDPDAVSRAVTPAEQRTLREAAASVCPGLGGPLASASTCLYTSTPDGHFIVDRLPGHRRTWTACGLSGHGFKLAPALGDALAGLATSGRCELPVGFLGLERLR